MSPDYVAVDEAVIRLVDERYGLYVAVGPGSNESLQTKLDLVRTSVLAHAFFVERGEIHDVVYAVTLV